MALAGLSSDQIIYHVRQATLFSKISAWLSYRDNFENSADAFFPVLLSPLFLRAGYDAALQLTKLENEDQTSGEFLFKDFKELFF